MAGRRPKPTALKVLQGNPGKRPLPENEPKPDVPARVPAPPPHLSEEAAREWRRTGKKLLRLGLLTDLDKAEFAIYCQSWGRLVEAEEALRRHGPIVMTPNRMPILSPYLSIANKAIDQVQRAAASFGMSPSSRAKVTSGEKPEEEDELDKLRRRRKS